jgi:hypothetical protein
MRETFGLTLEEISEVFDGPDTFRHPQHLAKDEESRPADPFADETNTKGYEDKL